MLGTITKLIPNSTSGRLRAAALVVSVILLGLVPVFVTIGLFTPLFAIKMAGALFFAVFAMSWDMASGYTGEISFGHALFFAVGGYTAGMLNIHSGIDPLLAIPVGAIAAAVVGLLIGAPSLRLEGPYFSLITLVVPLILLRIFIIFPDWTGGGRGLIAADAERTVPTLAFDPIMNYLIALALFLVSLTVFLIITRSNTGEILTAIRENPEAVAAAGLNPAKYKLFAFVVSGLIGGLAGALFVFTLSGSATPGSLLGLVISIEVIVAAVLGGIGTITGAALGGLVFFLLRDTLTQMEFIVPVLNQGIKEMAFLVFGVITLLFLFFLPEGLVRRFWMIVGRFVGDGRPSEAVADGGRTTARSVLVSVRNRLDDLFDGENE